MLPHGWENFYVVASQASATLIGLMFVVITLGADLARSEKAKGASTFVGSTVLHFGGVLFNSLVLLSPWPSPHVPSIILGCSAVAGLIYVASVARRVWQIEFVRLDAIDWAFYIGAPSIANAALIGAAWGLNLGLTYAPYAVAGSIALQLLVATRNSWDTAFWIVTNRGGKRLP